MRGPALLLTVTLAACSPPPRHDGMWTAIAIDGKAVKPGAFQVEVRDGVVTGGRDGCNNWGYVANSKPHPSGARMIASDAQGCRETLEQSAYRMALDGGNGAIMWAQSDRLRFSARGHEILTVRQTE